MNMINARVVSVGIALLSLLTPWAHAADPFELIQTKSSVKVTAGGKDLATYIYHDAKIKRPYLAHVRAPNGRQVTRNHPPIKGRDSTDHATMHPGIWLGFGDISGNDFWRNKATVKHVLFTQAPAVKDGVGSFTVLNRYRAKDKTLCEQRATYTFHALDAGTLIVIDSTFGATDVAFSFGDQEEMGLGVRAATPITVKKGGHIDSSHGGKNEKGTWGKTAAWIDYHGKIDGQDAGIMIIPWPGNFRKSWMHSRDYGVIVANAFGRKAMRQGPVSKVSVSKGGSLRLVYGILVHGPLSDRKAAAKQALSKMPHVEKP